MLVAQRSLITAPGGPGDTDIIIYGYVPSLSLAVVGCCWFGVAALLGLVVLLLRPRKWATACVTFGAAMEVVGYAMRSQSSQVDPYRLTFFVVQYFFIVVAPCFFSAAIYLIFGSFLKLAEVTNRWFTPRRILIIFVVCDAVTTIIQIAGAASIGTAESNNRDPNPANDALIAGLALQSLSFAIFLLVFVSICVRLQSRRLQLFPGSLAQYRWWLLLLLFIAVLVQLRTTFRLAESAQGVLGYLSTHEVYFGCLEFLPIALAVAALIALQTVRFASDALAPHGTLAKP